MKTIKSVLSTMLAVLFTAGTLLISQPGFAGDAADSIPDSTRSCLTSVDYNSITEEQLQAQLDDEGAF